MSPGRVPAPRAPRHTCHRVILALLVALSALHARWPQTARAHDKAATPAPTPTPTPTPPGTIAGRVAIAEGDGQRPARGAVVYIESADPRLWKDSAGERGRAATVRMKTKRFEPRVTPVLVGAEIAFPNQDPVFHNAFSRSGKNTFDLGLYKDGKSKSRKFQSPGVVRVYCNIHPRMAAFVLVLQNPWFAEVEADGSFRIDGVAPGEYTLKAWDEKGGESSTPVVVKPGAETTAELSLDARSWREVPHQNKFGLEYGKEPSY